MKPVPNHFDDLFSRNQDYPARLSSRHGVTLPVFKKTAADAAPTGDRQGHLQLEHGLAYATRARQHANSAC
jgi:hypothetical protein